MIHLSRFRGLRAQMMLALAGILVVFGAAASVLLILDRRGQEIAKLEETGHLLARYATERLYEAYLAAGGGETAGTAPLPAPGSLNRTLLQLHPAVVGFRLLDPSGRVLLDSGSPDAAPPGEADPRVVGLIAQAATAGPGGDGPTLSRRARRDGEEVLEILRVHTLRDQPLAVAAYEISLAGVREHALATSLAMLVATVLFFILLGLALSVIVSRAVLRPVTLLSAAAQALGQGFLDARVRASGSAEMEALAGAFDAMTRDLKGTVDKLSGLADEVSAASGSMFVLGADVAEGTREQAVQTRRTEVALEQLTGAARQVLGRASQVSGLGDSVKASFAEMTVTTGEIADSARALGEYVDRTHDSIMEINGSVGEVSRSAESLRILSDQAAQALASLHGSIRGVRDQTERSRGLSQSAHSQAAALGASTVEQAVAGVDRLRGIIDRAVGIIEGLSHRSAEVGRIATLIDEVTDRTNLLGINASIMAAQAGEHGAGFAVVAEEIKSLSLQIGGSTRDINRLLATMREEAAAAVGVIREGSESAAESVKLSEGVREALGRIVEHAAETGRMLAGIAAATDGQEADTRKLKELAENVAAMAREAADATRNQKAFSSRIVDATEGMRTLAEQVTRSTGEHSHNARQVAAALEELGEGVAAILRSVRGQMSEAEPVREALHTIRTLADSNQARAEAMGGTLSALASRADSLRAELSRFRFRGAPGAAPAGQPGGGAPEPSAGRAALPLVVDDPPTHQRQHGPPPDGPAVERRVAGQGAEARRVDDRFPFQIQDGDVGQPPRGQGALLGQAQDPGRGGGESLHQAGKG